MIYQRALRQLNTVFPKISIRPPTKKAIVRSLIQQIQCPSFSNNDFIGLKNKQTAIKPLNKLKKIVSTWLSVLTNNQKARQQQLSKPINRENIKKMQYMIGQSGQISSKSQFILFLTQTIPELSELSLSSSLSPSSYKQTQLPKQPQFFNTISQIGQQQYFKYLQQLFQKLGILQQLVQHQLKNMDHLQQLYNMVQTDQLFKKKDNNFYKVIKYNFKKTAQIQQEITEVRGLAYFYQDNIVYSVARIYYLVYLSRKQIEQNKQNYQYLNQIQNFLCERSERVFPKLYSRKISKPLILLQKIRQQCLRKHVFSQQPPNTKQILDKLQHKLMQISKILVNHEQEKKALAEAQFLQMFKQIQDGLVHVNKCRQFDRDNDQLILYVKKLIGLEGQLIRIFTYSGGKLQQRKTLSIQNSRMSSKSRADAQSRKSQIINGFRNTIKSNKSNISNNNIPQQTQIIPNKINKVDQGLDIFIYPQLSQTKINQNKYKTEQLSKNSTQYEKQCKNYIQKIRPDFGQILQDNQNFNPEQLQILIKSGESGSINIKQKQILQIISKNLIKPEITQKNIDKIFNPEFRFSVLKALSQKLIQMSYKNTKIIGTPEFNGLPQNVKKFIENRNSFLKIVNKQFQKIMGIATIISNLNFYKKYDVSRHQTYETFLKILLAQKQSKAYQLSFKDEKKVSKQTAAFINNKLYSSFIDTLTTLLPSSYNKIKQIINILDQLQFYVDFQNFTSEIVGNFMKDFQQENQKEGIQMLKKQMVRILSKWTNDCEQKLKNKNNDVFEYTNTIGQLNKLNQFIKICRNERVQIRDQSVQKLVAILDRKK